MFIARFFLGFGIGPKSATTPMFAAECSPKLIRGALVMSWQMWTAAGIMLGYIADLALYYVPDSNGITGLNWRLMMGSAGVPALIVCALIYRCPESPRYYLTKNRHQDAFKAMSALRFNKIQAARDIFYAHTLLEAETALNIGRNNKIWEILKIRRNRNALIASEVVMFMQQVSSRLFLKVLSHANLISSVVSMSLPITLLKSSVRPTSAKYLPWLLPLVLALSTFCSRSPPSTQLIHLDDETSC